jgi:hypothetical protein
MTLRELIISLATLLTLSACTSGSSGGSSNRNFDFKVSGEVSGHFVADENLSKHLPAAEKELEKWKNECEKIDGFNTQNLTSDLKVTSREDEIKLWPDLKSNSDVRIYDNVVEKIISANEFYSIMEQIDSNYSIKARHRNSASNGGRSTELVTIISTNPTHLKNKIDKARSSSDYADDNFVTCTRDYISGNNENRAVTFATFALKDGTTIKGILVTERNEYKNYTCTLHRPDRSVIRELRMADQVAEERMEFYSKEFVNPFSSRCHDMPGLLSVESVRDISGNRGLITLKKDEVLSIVK